MGVMSSEFGMHGANAGVVFNIAVQIRGLTAGRAEGIAAGERD